jgi:hypothetical protein
MYWVAGARIGERETVSRDGGLVASLLFLSMQSLFLWSWFSAVWVDDIVVVGRGS